MIDTFALPLVLSLALAPAGTGSTEPIGQADTGVQIVQTPGGPTNLGQAAEIAQIAAPARVMNVSSPSPATPVSSAQLTVEPRGAHVDSAMQSETPAIVTSVSPVERAEGRNLSADVPEGPDRCDPQRRLRPADCDRVIETRAAEYQSRELSAPSAEERLIAGQRELRPASTDLDTATRRLASGELDVSEAGLAVASVALADGRPEERDEDPAAEPSALDAIVASVTTLIVGAPPDAVVLEEANMIDPGIEAHLELARQDRALAVRAFVTAEGDRPLRWRIEAVSRTAAGTSSVAQSGTTRGALEGPVGVIVVPPESEGSVTLTVFDGEREVARDIVDLTVD